MIPWSTVQSLTIFFGPILLPKALAFYRSIRAPSTQPPIALTSSASRALNLLFIFAFAVLVSTLPYLTPSNIFTTTQSRLQTPTNVLFTRLAALHSLSSDEISLRNVFEQGGLEARLLYLRFGPDILSSSTHLIPDAKASGAGIAYLVYALPSLLAPHLLHLAVLGLVTNTWFGGKDAGRWRTVAVVAAVVLGVLDFVALAGYEQGLNARATRLSEVDAFFWKRRLVSRLLVCATDGLLGWMVWLSATKRAFVVPDSKAERVEAQTKVLEAVVGKLRGLGAVRNVVFRDRELRAGLEKYWVQEGEVMRDVFEDREVVGALNETLARVDMGTIEGEAGAYTDSILGNVRVMQAGGG